MKISQIIDKIDENQLFVPAFQREYVWKRPNANLRKPCLLAIAPLISALPEMQAFPAF